MATSLTPTMRVVRFLKRFIKRRLGYGTGRALLVRRLPRNSVGMEIGVHQGDFSEQLLRQLSPSELHLVDPWKHETSAEYKRAWYGGIARGQSEMDERYHSVCHRFAAEIAKGCVHIHRRNSAEALAAFADEYFDWIYIDGNHLYEFVKVDLELSWPKLKKRGVLAGDDYMNSGWWQGGVKKAVDEFCRIRAIRLKVLNNEFMIRK